MGNAIKLMIGRKKNEAILLLVVVVVCLVFGAMKSVFLSWGNIASILSNNAVYGIMALGMMLVISTGNIDVSVGAQLAVISMVLSEMVLNGMVTNPFTAIVVSLLMGLTMGLVNGVLVAVIKLPAIIVTLGTLNIMRGALLLIVGSQWKSGLPGWFTDIARAMPVGIGLKITSFAWIFMCVITYLIIYHTVEGRRILAAGSNPEASMRIGLSPTRAYINAFGFMGICVGIGSLFFTANIGMAQPMAGAGYEMVLISAVVIGGTKFSGGRLSVLGTFLGVLLLGIIENGLVITKVPVYWQECIRGIVIIAAIVSSAIKLPPRVKRGSTELVGGAL